MIRMTDQDDDEHGGDGAAPASMEMININSGNVASDAPDDERLASDHPETENWPRGRDPDDAGRYSAVVSNSSPTHSLRASLTSRDVAAYSNRARTSVYTRMKSWYGDANNTIKIRYAQWMFAMAALVTAIILIGIYARSSPSSATVPAPMTYDVRLPTSVVPTHYNMVLTASIADATFSGDTHIAITFVNATNTILFHSKSMTLTNIYMLLLTGEKFVPISATDTKQYDLYSLVFDRIFPTGTLGVLYVSYSGTITRELAGFYLSDYTTSTTSNPPSEVRTIASTHFESSDARRAFPCFDEPAMKAVFSLSIVTDSAKVVLSNTPSVSTTQNSDGSQRVDFAPSPRMSTYLLAWCITDFVSALAVTKRSGIPIRVWTAKDKLGGVQVALNAAVASIDAYEAFFGVNYPLAKLDQVAIPNFPVGAMENWGMVTYRESALLVDPASSESMTEQNIVTTVAHELAHQWFGNIVTMSWWNDLWLNEGFASFVEWIGVRAYTVATNQTSWDEDGQMVQSAQATALALDSSQYSHPIVQVVNEPSDVDSLFDMISYDKGCSILMMLADVLSFYDAVPASLLQDGLHTYLTTHQYGNAVSDDLWTALESAAAPPNQQSALSPSDVDLVQYMHAYTNQMGYPLITLTPNTGPRTINGFTATQSRFIELPYAFQDPTLRDTQSQYRWDVKINLMDQSGPLPTHLWFHAAQPSIAIPYVDSQQFLLLNAGGRRGFYRVNYPTQMWDAISSALIAAPSSSPPIAYKFANGDRCGLIDDVWTLALAGLATYANAFSLIAFLGDRTYAEYNDYTPFASAFSQLGRISRLILSNATTTGAFNQYVINKVINQNSMSIAPWNGYPSSHLFTMLQQSMVSTLVAYGDVNARSIAHMMFTAFQVNPTIPVPVNIRDAVYRVGIEDGTDNSWSFLYQQYAHSIDPSERKRILRALTRSYHSSQLSMLLDWSIDATKIASQDTERIIIFVASNIKGGGLALTWVWLQTNYDKLYALFGSSSFTLSELIIRVIGLFQTRIQLDDAKQFFAGKDLGTAKRALMQAYEQVETNIYWIDNRQSEFVAALQTANI